MGVWGIAKRGFGRALKAAKGKGKVYKTIKSVKPLSGKTPWHISASPNTAESRKRILRTDLSLKRSQKIEDAEKAVKKGKEKLKHLEDTGQAEKVGDRYYKKGFSN
jgi:hypothetical protein